MEKSHRRRLDYSEMSIQPDPVLELVISDRTGDGASIKRDQELQPLRLAAHLEKLLSLSILESSVMSQKE